jgi:hypothetical protein
MTTTTKMVVEERNVRKASPVMPEKTATPTLTTTKQVVAERKSAETRKVKSFPVPPPAPEKEKMATPILTTRMVVERKSAETRKEKSFPVPLPAPEEEATPILMTRMETRKSAYPNQASPVPLVKAEQAKKAT